MSGTLHLVSVGPGFAEHITPRAQAALQQSDIIVSYELYLKWVQPLIAGKEVFTTPLTQERERALKAIEAARAGKNVALVSSGDIGIYAMAALAFEEMQEDDTFAVDMIPGITAANACASLLGSPLSHDFATLSLSDLLCPWDWIEQRARKIAEADLSVVLYNVQSAGRQDGIYRILQILLEHKASETLCGIVRNAYRPEQTTRICTLAELAKERFDMLTTLVIGNRFTRKKRSWIYTPRGYNNWTTTSALQSKSSIPTDAIWVFSGTSDGNLLANEIIQAGESVVISVASDYGLEIAQTTCPSAHIISGRMGVEARRQELSNSRSRLIVDATHPFASQISQQLIALSQELHIPYIRFERTGTTNHTNFCDSIEAAATQAIQLGKRIFLATGSKELAVFLNSPNASEREWYVRLTPEPTLIQRAIDLGIPRNRICAMQGPFSQSFNETLWRDWKIDCIITRDSGDMGGYSAKIAAANALNIPVLVIRRPAISYPVMASTFDQVFQFISSLGVRT